MVSCSCGRARIRPGPTIRAGIQEIRAVIHDARLERSCAEITVEFCVAGAGIAARVRATSCCSSRPWRRIEAQDNPRAAPASIWSRPDKLRVLFSVVAGGRSPAVATAAPAQPSLGPRLARRSAGPPALLYVGAASALQPPDHAPCSTVGHIRGGRLPGSGWRIDALPPGP